VEKLESFLFGDQNSGFWYLVGLKIIYAMKMKQKPLQWQNTSFFSPFFI
jgi:hypothetical protein